VKGVNSDAPIVKGCCRGGKLIVLALDAGRLSLVRNGLSSSRNFVRGGRSLEGGLADGGSSPSLSIGPSGTGTDCWTGDCPTTLTVAIYQNRKLN
jgi:hypothetical protein